MKFNSMIYIALLILVGVLSYIPWLGSFGPLDPTDSFFLESGRELIETGNYLLPLNNYEPWLDKPILYFWLVSLCYKIGGISTFAGRLPSALSAIALGLSIFCALRPAIRKRTAFLAGLIFLSCPLSSVVGHVSLTDMTLSLCITGCILFLHKGLVSKSNRDLFIGYLWLGLGFWCKGPIAVIICGLSLILYLILKRRSLFGILEEIKALHPLPGFLVAAVINLPWYLSANAATNGKFFETFFFTQNFGRMVGKVNHQGPFWFYIPVFWGGFFPWSLLGFSSKRFFQRSLQKNNKDGPETDLFRLCLCWFFIVIVLFSVVKTKLPTYILSAVPAFAIMTALQLEAVLRAGLSRRLIWTGALSTIGMAVVGITHSRWHGYIGQMIGHNLWVVVLMFVLLSIYTFAMAKKQGQMAMIALCLTAFFGCGILVPEGLKAMYDHKQVGFNRLASIAKNDNANLATFSAEEPSLCWTLHKRIPRIIDEKDAQRFMQNTPSPRYLLAPKEMLEDMIWFRANTRIVAASGKWQLIELYEKK